jgi:hypothetical protein
MVLGGMLGVAGVAVAACAIRAAGRIALAGVLVGGAGATLTAAAVLAAAAGAGGCRRCGRRQGDSASTSGSVG